MDYEYLEPFGKPRLLIVKMWTPAFVGNVECRPFFLLLVSLRIL